MRAVPFIASLALAGSLAGGAALADTTSSTSAVTIGADYTAEALLSPCQEADNDARWGEAAEVECEQYLIGFVAALELAGMIGEGSEICLPADNVADEVRWAYMRWVHADYRKRTKMTASEAVMATLTENFPCE